MTRKTPQDPGRGAGRPRSARADRAILQATIQVLARRGYAGLTLEGVAARAGVGKATLYRRWKTKDDAIVAAAEAFVAAITIPDTGRTEDDLLHLMRNAVSVYRGTPGKVMPGLVSAMAQNSKLAKAVRNGFLAARRAALTTVLTRGIQRGELRNDIDIELALDFLGGPLFYRLLVTGGPLDDALARGVVDVLLRGIGTERESEQPRRDA